jgi:hypothetical protein
VVIPGWTSRRNSVNGVHGSTGYEVNSLVGEPIAFEWAVHTEILQAPIGQTNAWGGATSAFNWFEGYTFNEGVATYSSRVFDGYVIGTRSTCFSGDPFDVINTVWPEMRRAPPSAKEEA